MKFGYEKEHAVVGNGKTQGSCVHMQLEYVMLNIDSTTYIYPCYGLDYAFNTYKHAFVVLKSQSLWRDPMGPKWLPNPVLLQAKG